MPSTGELQAMVDKINDAIQWIIDKIGEIPGIVDDAVDHWYIPGFIADGVRWCAQKVIDLGKTVLAKIKEVMVGVAAPFVFINHAINWSDLSGKASSVQGNVTTKANDIKDYWKGIAADAYGRSATKQADASGAVKKIADDARAALIVVVVAGLAFYVALGVIIAQFIVGFGAACVALGSLVFSWAGVLAALGEVTITPAAIIAAVGALTAVVGAQANAFGTMNAAAKDNSKFPGGKWPSAGSGNFSDGTVNDGDADWSVVDR